MKKQLLYIFFLLLTLSVHSQGNDEYNKEQGVIYHYSMWIADVLRIENSVSNPNSKKTRVNNGSSTTTSFSSEVKTLVTFSDKDIDSIATLTEALLAEKLNTDIKCVYKTNKKGKKLTSKGLMGQLAGFPENTYKKTVVSYPAKKYYISAHAQFHSVEETTNNYGSNTVATHRAKLRFYIEVKDANSKDLWVDDFTIDDFEGIISLERKKVGVGDKKLDVTLSDTYQPHDYINMYTVALKKAIERKKD